MVRLGWCIGVRQHSPLIGGQKNVTVCDKHEKKAMRHVYHRTSVTQRLGGNVLLNTPDHKTAYHIDHFVPVNGNEARVSRAKLQVGFLAIPFLYCHSLHECQFKFTTCSCHLNRLFHLTSGLPQHLNIVLSDLVWKTLTSASVVDWKESIGPLPKRLENLCSVISAHQYSLRVGVSWRIRLNVRLGLPLSRFTLTSESETKMWELSSSASLAKLFPKPSTTLSPWQQERWAIWRLVVVCRLLLWNCQDWYSKDWKTIRFVDLVQLFGHTWSWCSSRRLERCLRCRLLRLNRKDSVTRAASSTESSSSSWSRAETSPEETALEVNTKQCHPHVKTMRWFRCQNPRKYNLKLQYKSTNGTKLIFFSEWRQEHLWRPFPWRELQAEALRPRLAQHGQRR